jgi:hypothetical protein
LVSSLENLCNFEETVVRDAACESLVALSNKLSEEENIATIVPAVTRLSDGTGFTQKVAALNLMCSIYEKAGEYKVNLRK